MIPFHSILPEIAQREVRCIHLYYQKYLHWSAKSARELSAGCLDRLSPRPARASTFLQLFQEHVLDDFHKTRLKQHYTLFKLSLTGN